MQPSSREIALLTNPVAGHGRGARHRIVVVDRFRDAGYRVRDVQGADSADALAQARALVADPEISALVVCGGDGMVNVGIQAVAGTGRPLGIIPSGTGNDVARYLDLPRTDPAAAADRVIAGRTRTIDLARSGDRYFATVLAAGFDALVNERANRMSWPSGQMRYNLATIAELRTFTPIPYTLELDGVELRTEAMLVAVGNGPSFGGGLRIAEGALLDDGLLDVIVIGRMSRLELVRVYPQLFRGTHVRHPQFQRHRVRQVTLSAPGIIAYADGERFAALPLSLEADPGALTVLA